VRAVAHIDGGARPTNPGHAGFAVVIRLYPQDARYVLSRYIGWRTNNVAEYFGLVSAIKYANFLGAKELHVISDSRLVVEQVHGRWRVQDDALRFLNREARDLLSRFFPSSWAVSWVRREENVEADRVCSEAIQAGRYRNPFSRRHLKDKSPGRIIDPFAS
jgi:ribonuclease HI